jgi:hypothetical protein
MARSMARSMVMYFRNIPRLSSPGKQNPNDATALSIVQTHPQFMTNYMKYRIIV